MNANDDVLIPVMLLPKGRVETTRSSVKKLNTAAISKQERISANISEWFDTIYHVTLCDISLCVFAMLVLEFQCMSH